MAEQLLGIDAMQQDSREKVGDKYVTSARVWGCGAIYDKMGLAEGKKVVRGLSGIHNDHSSGLGNATFRSLSLKTGRCSVPHGLCPQKVQSDVTHTFVPILLL